METQMTTQTTNGTMNVGQFHPMNGVRCVYVRGRGTQLVGLIMTHMRDGVMRMGFSLCNQSEDTFRKSNAKELAFERLQSIPTVSVDSRLHDTPMNRALTALAMGMVEKAPQTIVSGAKRELARRIVEFGKTNTSFVAPSTT